MIAIGVSIDRNDRDSIPIDVDTAPERSRYFGNSASKSLAVIGLENIG
jgi:hypothetical protein